MKNEEVLCHLGFFIAVLILYFASVLLSPKKDISLQKPSILSDIEDSLTSKSIGEIIDPRLSEEDEQIIKKEGGYTENDIVCSLYIAKSAIPNSGFGIFSTEEISVGEIVLGESTAFSINNIKVSPHLLYMKHHVEYNNISGGIGGSAIVATKVIEAGEELYFNFDDYPQELRTIYQNLHPSDPTEESYVKADHITQRIIESIPITRVSIKPKKKQYKKKDIKRVYKERPMIDATPLFQVMKDVLKEYDETVSNLIPVSDSMARSIVEYGGRSMYIPKRRSLESLTENGICVNGIQPSKSLIYERENGGITTRSVKKGEIITTSPILVTTAQTDERCLKLNGDGVVLCFLSFSSKVNEGVSAGDCDEEKTGDCPYNKANAYYQWSESNQFNKGVENLSISDFVKVRDLIY